MTDFDKYKELYCGNFAASCTNFPSDLNTLSYNVAREQNNKFEKEIYNLIEFIRLWKDKYEFFCHEFNCHTWIEQDTPIWSVEPSYIKHIPLPKSEFYIELFFNMVLNKKARFESIASYNITTNTLDPANKDIHIFGKNFNLSCKKNSNHYLDIKINTALICSLIVALSNNYTIYEWYSKQSRFKEFIDNISKSHYFIRFSINDNINRVHIGGGTKDSLSIDIDRNWLYFVMSNETLRVENMLYYNHLDCLFGKDRKEPLTEEDLQLYSIVNEGRKPLMFDFEW